MEKLRAIKYEDLKKFVLEGGYYVDTDKEDVLDGDKVSILIDALDIKSIKCDIEHRENDMTVRIKDNELLSIYCNCCGQTHYHKGVTK